LSLRERRRRTLLAGIMLVAFALRALIPPGFMLGGDRPFSIEICWDGFPAAMLAPGDSRDTGSMDMDSTMDMGRMDMGSTHGGHPHSASEHCVFGSACTAGPIPHLALPSNFSPARLLPAPEFASIAGAVHLVHLPQSRAPPVQLS
jgi:hypothetical protein